MDHIQQQVLAQVDQDAMLELASALIRIPSFKTEETPVARFLADTDAAVQPVPAQQTA